MDITYPLLIQEDIAQLQAAEKAARDKTRTDRGFGFSRRGGSRASVRLRRSWPMEILDYSVRTVQRWWQCRGGSRASVRLRRSWPMEILDYSVRTVQRWWQCDREGGLAELLAPPQRRGMAERITPEAWEGLQAEMRAIGGRRKSICATLGTSPTASMPFPSCSGGAS
jgi:hypothetical protein